ncbi:cytochrome c [Paenibacillus athensensis]|nr:cytochrome c [Paenibacillus athensensis]MCD1259648.1 cytochrome c [Paenibacillus athensensis]
MRSKQVFAAAALGVVILLLSACGSKDGGASGSKPQADGPALYRNYCISCHGGGLQDVQGPNLEHVGSRLSEEQIVRQITQGGGGMPSFKVSIRQEDIQTLAQWLAAMK